MNAAARGARRERQVRDLLLADGWVVSRSAGSHGRADLMAARYDAETDRPEVMLVQVKTDAQTPYENFRPAERAALLEDAERAGATAWLVWWPARGKPRWIPPAQWPP